jgi:predicted phosphodiesterase
MRFNTYTGKGLVFKVGLLIVCCIWCATASNAQPARYTDQIRDGKGSPSIIVVSDTQSPLWIETLRLKTDRNEEATRLILNSIAADSTCEAVIHLGDITVLGSFELYWNDFDEKAKAIRNAGIPIYPIFGNHEYMPFKNKGIEHMIQRFPYLEIQSWYYQRIGSVAFVLLNSNISKLKDGDGEKQIKWIAKTLTMFDEDTSIAVVIVGCHHSPYTNSTIVDPSEEIQTDYVPAFIKSKKARLFLSGHSHAFEHFQIEGKDFLVIGGGGGLLHPLLQGTEQRWRDIFTGEERRFFHYVRLLPGNKKLVVQILKANTKQSSIEIVYQIEIPYAM